MVEELERQFEKKIRRREKGSYREQQDVRDGGRHPQVGV